MNDSAFSLPLPLRWLALLIPPSWNELKSISTLAFHFEVFSQWFMAQLKMLWLNLVLNRIFHWFFLSLLTCLRFTLWNRTHRHCAMVERIFFGNSTQHNDDDDELKAGTFVAFWTGEIQVFAEGLRDERIHKTLPAFTDFHTSARSSARELFSTIFQPQ